MKLNELKHFARLDTAGWLAMSSLLVCGLSGILLAIPYDFSRAYPSVQELILLNPTASLMRNLHYWSAELFFILSLLHVGDHFWKDTESNIKSRRTWLILILMIFFLGYEMLSGFVLKGDEAGVQARRIFASLLQTIPVVGNMLRSALAGSEENWQIVYVQHIATGTIFLFIGIFSHLKRIWPPLKTFVLLLFLLLMVSVLFRAPLGVVGSSQLKGPWFFVGIQEILHQISHPGYLVFSMLILFLLLYFLPGMKDQLKIAFKRFLLVLVSLYLVATVLVLVFRGDNWEWRNWKEFSLSDEQLFLFDPVNLLKKSDSKAFPENQKIEGCLLCHSAMTGLTESHNPMVMGCVSCHKGDPFTADQWKAHRSMVLVPGDFSNVRQTCGTQNCHSEITDRMTNSLMTTQSGIIAVDKFLFNESKSLNDTFQIKDLGHSAADTHLRNLCAGCHLGNPKVTTGNATWLERGGGCNGCHLHYNEKATENRNRMQSKTGLPALEVHPTIDLQISNDRCKSCHSRSGRISLNYEGWNETALKAVGVNASDSLTVLPDERILAFVQDDIHHQKGMACIDCHNSYEIMGEGKHLVHNEDAVNVQCVDCHPTGQPNSEVIGNLPDKDSQMIAWLRKYDPRNRVVVTAKGERALLNTRVDSAGGIVLTDKLKGAGHFSKPASSACVKGKGHSRLSCESCHTAWVPQCIGCHNSYEKETPGYDLLTGKRTKGSWVEFAGKNLAEPPVLGVSGLNGEKIVTTMPGMVLTIDQESFQKGSGSSFHRLYAPASGHTTQREGRSCKSCHNNPLTIGYGRGELRFEVAGASGKWRFEPRYALSEQDGLPEDGWIGFLKEGILPNATRTGLRPFTVKEQKRILEVGSCLTCHAETSQVMDWSLVDFERTVAKRSKFCLLPSW